MLNINRTLKRSCNPSGNQILIEAEHLIETEDRNLIEDKYLIEPEKLIKLNT